MNDSSRRTWRTVQTSLDVSLLGCEDSSSSKAFLFLPDCVTAGKQRHDE